MINDRVTVDISAIFFMSWGGHNTEALFCHMLTDFSLWREGDFFFHSFAITKGNSSMGRDLSVQFLTLWGVTHIEAVKVQYWSKSCPSCPDQFAGFSGGSSSFWHELCCLFHRKICSTWQKPFNFYYCFYDGFLSKSRRHNLAAPMNFTWKSQF